MLYLITGGAGFIGSSLAEALLGKGNSVRILDNFSSGKRANLDFTSTPELEVIEGDIRDPDTCRQAISGADYVLHHAALASVPLSVDDPVLANDINITGTLNMLVASRDAGVRRFVFASSTAVYGDTDDGTSPKVETMQPAPLSPYAINKLTGEEYCRLFHRIYGLETVALRYFNVFGPKQDPASEYAAVIPKFIEALLSGKSPIVYGDGWQSRDFIYIDDVVRANCLACELPDAAGKTFNIGCGRQLPINELLNELKAILHSNATAIYKDARPGDIRHSWADISLARKYLDFEPAFSFRDALLQTASWYKEIIIKKERPQ
jgi:UDP-N-acetylglucosamine 4-epimerase